METGAQGSAVDKKLLALVAVVLALILIAFCYVVFLLIRNKQAAQPAQPQLAQTEFPLPAPAEAVVLYLPVAVNSVAPAPVPAPSGQSAPTSTLWRFISINENDIGTFENIGNPSQRLAAKCKDPKRPVPDKGELYELDDSGILKPQSGSKKFQRFELIAR
jgi:hypothetical protein